MGSATFRNERGAHPACRHSPLNLPPDRTSARESSSRHRLPTWTTRTPRRACTAGHGRRSLKCSSRARSMIRSHPPVRTSRAFSASTSRRHCQTGGHGMTRATQAADLILDSVESYAPGFRASVVGRSALSPLDLETRLGLSGGDIFHGALGLDQLWAARPVLGFGDYKTPLHGTVSVRFGSASRRRCHRTPRDERRATNFTLRRERELLSYAASRLCACCASTRG